MSNAKRFLSLVLLLAMTASVLGGCFFKPDDSEELITEVTSDYLDTIFKGKFKSASKYVYDRQDAMKEFEAKNDDHEDIIEAVLDEASYEIEEVVGTRRQGEGFVIVTFSLPDWEAYAEADDGTFTKSSFVNGIGDLRDNVESEFRVDVIYDEDAWYVDPDTTDDLREFIYSIGGDLDFSPFAEGRLTRLLNNFIGLIGQGDFDGARDVLDGYFEYSENEFTSSYAERMSYSVLSVDKYDDYAEVELTVTHPDVTAFVESHVDNEADMTPILANYIYAMIRNNDGESAFEESMGEYLSEHIDEMGSSTDTVSLTFYSEENGDLGVFSYSMYNFLPVISTYSFTFDLDPAGGTMQAAKDQLVASGTITEAEYNSCFGLGPQIGSYGILYEVYEGSELYTFDYDIGYEGITIHPRTWGYYDRNDVFEYDLVIDGKKTVTRGQYYPETDSTDHLYITYEFEDGIFHAGEYVFTVYETGAGNSNVLCRVTFVVENDIDIEDPLSYLPDPPETAPVGESFTYDDTGRNDVYSCNFSDRGATGGNFYGAGEHYETGQVGLYVNLITWAYYDTDDLFYFDIYKDGQLIEGPVMYTISGNFEDHFYLEYEPEGGLEAGDYTIVLYNASEGHSPHSTYYLSVG